jgi:hypothetical protein
MANWAMTAYVIEGDKQVLEKIYHAIKHPKIIKDSSEGWEGNVLAALGIEWENRNPDGSGYYMRGFIQEDTVSMEGGTLRFNAEEAWGATDFNEVLEENLPVKIFYCVEEQGEEVFATNDKDGKYFFDKFYADICIDGEYDSEYFIDEASLLKWLSDKTDGRVKTQEDIDEFNADYEDEALDDENYIHVYEYQIC